MNIISLDEFRNNRGSPGREAENKSDATLYWVKGEDYRISELLNHEFSVISHEIDNISGGLLMPASRLYVIAKMLPLYNADCSAQETDKKAKLICDSCNFDIDDFPSEDIEDIIAVLDSFAPDMKVSGDELIAVVSKTLTYKLKSLAM